MPVSNLILHEYPQPIATCYERLIAAVSPFERFENCRHLLEAAMKYAACIAIAEYLQSGREDDRINADLAMLNRPTLGHWLKLLRSCIRHNHADDSALFPPDLFGKRKAEPILAAAYNAMAEYTDGEVSARQSISVLDFLSQYVTYRNKTVGHGAPPREHVVAVAPILEEALMGLLNRLDVLRRINLIYVRDIHVERTRFVHSLVRLMGTSQMPLPDLIREQERALLAGDRQLFVSRPDDETPYLNLHPLVIFANDDVYLLHQSDLSRGVDYICHHSGKFYSADRIFEDFRQKFGPLLERDVSVPTVDADEVFLNAVRISLIDGVIEESERDYLKEMQTRLGLSEARAEQLESFVARELGSTKKTDPGPGTPAATAGRSCGELILFLSYASVRSGFWSELVSRLAAQAQKRRALFAMLTPDPIADYEPAAMVALVAGVEELVEQHQPDVMIWAPSPSAVVLDFILGWLQEIDLPIVTIDTELFDRSVFSRIGRKLPPLVQVDNEAGGRMAGELLLSTISDPTEGLFLVMPGIDDAPHSERRVRGFTQIVEESGGRVRRLSEGEFRRHEARRVFDDFLLDADLERYSGIFCCNDEMALGVYHALAGREEKQSFPIVGFNGTMEMRTILTVDGTGHLLGTIDQNYQEYVETVFDAVERVLTGQDTQERYLIQPRLVVRRDVGTPDGSLLQA